MKYALRENYEQMFDRMVSMGAEYIYGYQLKSMVMGISGGIDSAVTAVLAEAVCRKLREERDYDCRLIGRIMPIESNKKEETSRGMDIAKVLCNEFKAIDLTELYKVIRSHIDCSDETMELLHGDWGKDVPHDVRVRNGNLKARLRMMQLYHLASKYGGIVLSTDNLTELMLGFWTLHGDVGDFGFIQGLWKTEVYGLANWMVDNGYGADSALQPCIDAVPTDGLGVTTSDFDQLGYKSYREIDEKLIALVNAIYERKDLSAYKDNPVAQRWARTSFKRDNPYNLQRADIVGFNEDTDFI